MSIPRTRARAVSISSDSSQAVEDNTPKFDTDSDENPHHRRFRIINPHTPSSQKLKNGAYGMFSGSGPGSPRTPKSSLAGRKRAAKDKSKSKKRSRGVFGETVEERQDSPLFEPENGFGRNGDVDGDEDVVMQSPSAAADWRRQSNRRKRPLDGSNRQTPILVEDVESESGAALEAHDLPSSAQTERDIETSLEVFENAPLPGNTDVLPEYVKILEALCASSNKMNEHSAAIRNHDKEDAELTANLEKLPTEEAKHFEDIARECAKAIQEDMKNIACDMDAIKQALEQRHAEAELGRTAVARLMKEKKVEYEMRRAEIQSKRAAAVEEQRHSEDENVRDLKKRKAELEMEGGLAMAFALGRKFQGMLGEKKCGLGEDRLKWVRTVSSG